MSASTINALIESKRYNPEILPELEKHLQEQLGTKTYNFEANLAILKLYQFYPHKENKDVIAKILIKALMNLPNTDFLLCSYLVPERLQKDEKLSKLFSIANLLESAKFIEFWAEANSAREVLSVAPEFDAAIRKFITGLLSTTYQTITTSELGALLSLDDAQLNTLISAQGWKQNTPATVTFPPSEELQAKTKKVAESFTLEQMSKVLTSIHH
jgi:translation initiation factor 3 subunit K